MRILYISQYYPPETAAPAARASELGKLWAGAGHEVMVLTGFPNHPTGSVHQDYRSNLWRLWMRDDQDGVRVRRTWLIPLPNRKSWERMLNYGSFCVSAALRGAFLSRPDVVIATSPQLLVGVSGWMIARWKRVPFVFEVRDLWPESLEAVGASRSGSILLRALRKLAGFLYKAADHIVVVTQPFKDHLEREWRVPAEKISVVVNGVDQNFFSPQVRDPEVIREFGLAQRFVVGYIGTIGNAHGIETLVETASVLQISDPEIFILVVGEGAEKQKLRELVAENQLSNIGIFAGQPRSCIPAIVAATDVCLVLLKDSELFKTVVPTKMLEFMACGRPLVAAVQGEAARIVEESGAGITVAPGDAAAVSKAIRFLRDDGLQARLGHRGRSFIVNRLTREATAKQYLSVLGKIAERGKPIDGAQIEVDAQKKAAKATGGRMQ